MNKKSSPINRRIYNILTGIAEAWFCIIFIAALAALVVSVGCSFIWGMIEHPCITIAIIATIAGIINGLSKE